MNFETWRSGRTIWRLRDLTFVLPFFVDSGLPAGLAYFMVVMRNLGSRIGTMIRHDSVAQFVSYAVGTSAIIAQKAHDVDSWSLVKRLNQD